MSPSAVSIPRSLEAFVALAGVRAWRTRLAEIRDLAAAGPRAGQAIRERHAAELAIERLRSAGTRAPAPAERELADLAAQTVTLAGTLSAAGKQRLREVVRAGLAGEQTLIPLFHLLRTAALHRARGFTLRFAGLEDGAPFDLLLHGDHIEAEIACEVVSADQGRGVHRGAWYRLADRVDPDLQTWLGDHPGRYLLKMTLAQGLHGGLSDVPTDGDPTGDSLAELHGRIRTLLASSTRQDHDEAMVLRLDPLLLTAAQADALGLLTSLRQQFGPEAHLSVTTAGGGVFVMAARAGQENAIAVAFRKRMAAIAPTRLSGTRPGILAMFVEDTNRSEWRGLRERLELEGEARQFLTNPEARPVVAVTFASRLELFGLKGPDSAPDGELRFRNPGHPAARSPGLASAVLSSM
ncbi:MAG: hypothetical protein P4L71_16965 [Acetobacteraceae bacterium]|nr:hypothetical protein [Acetobacteraceae bacterium]